MKLLGMSASTRAWGNCEAAIRLALVSAADQGAETEFIRLPDLEIAPCRGCFKCLSDAKTCALTDDLWDLLERISSADALVVASPVYFGLPPAILVGLLDRLLAVAARDQSGDRRRYAVTVTVMGNRAWRGLAEPIVNITASLLGFELAESLSVVAEGPGEVLADSETVESLKYWGGRLVGGGPHAARGPSGATLQCPTCRSDFFRIESRSTLVCPVCGEAGDLSAYLRDGTFLSTGSERRWGLVWLRQHVEDWIKPSVRRYALSRRQVSRNLAELRRLSALKLGHEALDRGRVKPWD
ncbi:MAG: NAD(P)H-dependent oxidoreductase [Candidatus Eisenbacteria bacterium]